MFMNLELSNTVKDPAPFHNTIRNNTENILMIMA